MSLNISPQKPIEGNEFLKTSSTMSNSHSSQTIPKKPNKFKRSNSSSKLNYLVPDPGANFIFFQPNDTDSNKIVYLKKSYEARVNKLLSNLKNCVSNLTSFNSKEIIDETLFVEKEKTIADLYEQISIIKTEYEENKVEMDRLQKVISVLEIDLNKVESQLKESNENNKKLNNEISKYQAENFELNLKLKNALQDKEKNTSQVDINEYIEHIHKLEAMKNELEEQKEKIIKDYDDLIKKKEDSFKNQYDSIVKETKEKINELHEANQNLEDNIKELSIELELKEDDIKKLYSENSELISHNQAIVNRVNYLEQLVILLKAKISGIKTEMINLQKTTTFTFDSYKEENEKIYALLLDKMNGFIKKNNREAIEEGVKKQYERHIIEQFNIIEKSQKDNKALLNAQQEYIKEIKLLNEKIENYEIENRALSVKLEKKNNSYKGNVSYKGLSNDAKLLISNKIMNLKLKYKNQIQLLHKQINDLIVIYKNSAFSNNTNNALTITQMQKKIDDYKHNIEEYKKALLKKDRKINALQATMSQSFHSISSGMKNVKIANLLDNEVKQFLKQTKEDTYDNTSK